MDINRWLLERPSPSNQR